MKLFSDQITFMYSAKLVLHLSTFI